MSTTAATPLHGPARPATAPVPAQPAGASTSPRSTSPRRAALIAGVGYAAIFVLAIFANFLARERLITPGDADATAADVTGAELTFRLGLVAFLVIFVLDVVVAWALHVVFRRVHADLSLVAAWLRVVYTVFLGVALVFFFQALQLYGADYLAVVDRAQLNAQALLALETFNAVWLVGLVAFGVHLVLLGYLIVRYRIAPRLLGVVLGLAGTAYVIDTVAHALLADYAAYSTGFLIMVLIPSVLAEAWFTGWLLLRAGRSTTPVG